MVRDNPGPGDDATRGRSQLAALLRGATRGQGVQRTTFAARTVGAAMADLLLPRACTVCERILDDGDRGLVCGLCWTRLPALPWPRCDRCGHPTYGEACRWCQVLPPFVRASRSVAWAAGEVGLGVVHALKYGGWHRVAVEMARRMARCDWPRDVLEERSALVPVPLSSKRMRERGYNQSVCLAEALARSWKIPVWNHVLARSRHTETQTRLTPGERLRNVSGAFAARASRDTLGGTHLILVDDIVTTAATLNACAAALCAGGARIVSFVTFGRAPALGDRW